MYKNGDGVQQDYHKAMEYYLKAADHRDEWAHLYIGHMYYTGEGVKQDYLKAMKYFLESEILGNLEAQYYIGIHSFHFYSYILYLYIDQVI